MLPGFILGTLTTLVLTALARRLSNADAPASRPRPPAPDVAPERAVGGFQWGAERFPEDFGFEWRDEASAPPSPDHPSGFRFFRRGGAPPGRTRPRRSRRTPY